MKKIYEICFSPAGKTEKIIRQTGKELCRELKAEEPEYVSITRPEERNTQLNFDENDFVLIAVPTYAGRVPNKIMPFIKENLKGNGTMGAAIVTYGNRNFDDSLIELRTLMTDNGFQIIGGGTFVCEHSFAQNLATGRPGPEDMLKAGELGAGLARKLIEKNEQVVELPGDKDFHAYYVPKGVDGKPAVFLKAKPVTDFERCINCGKCSEVCPMGSIVHGKQYETTGICIKCQACIKVCPVNARCFVDEAFLSHQAMLNENFAKNENTSEIYL